MNITIHATWTTVLTVWVGIVVYKYASGVITRASKPWTPTQRWSWRVVIPEWARVRAAQRRLDRAGL